MLCQQSNRIAEALKYYNNVIDTNPNYPEAQYNSALIYYNSYRIKDAEESFKKVVAAN